MVKKPMEHRTGQSGNILFLILIAVALFAALAYVVIQNNRTGSGDVSKEKQKLETARFEQCAAAINAAVLRLELNGCKGRISYEFDGSSGSTGAPADGSCSVFHPKGGGVIPCESIDYSCLDALVIGQQCAGAVYVGTIGSRRVYAGLVDSVSSKFATSHTNTPADANDGKANTDTIISSPPPPATYPAFTNCRALGSKWYLPAIEELRLMWTNRAAIDLSSIGLQIGPYYMSSTQLDGGNYKNFRFSVGNEAANIKDAGNEVRCFLSR